MHPLAPAVSALRASAVETSLVGGKEGAGVIHAYTHGSIQVGGVRSDCILQIFKKKHHVMLLRHIENAGAYPRLNCSPVLGRHGVNDGNAHSTLFRGDFRH